MKKSTVANKLNALLGISEDVVEKLAAPDNPAMEPIKKKKLQEYKNQPRLYGFTIDEFQHVREMEGTRLFLQAPELFTIRVCPNCNEHYAVSRQAVGYCSYECLAESFRKDGFEWTKGGDLVALANDPQVWNKNEPLWTIKLLKLQACLQEITETISSSWTSESQPENDSDSSTQDRSTSPPSVSQETTGTTGGSSIFEGLEQI